MSCLNLTPHAVHVYADDRVMLTFPAHDPKHPARLTQAPDKRVGSITEAGYTGGLLGLPVLTAPRYTGVEHMPAPERLPGGGIIVSQMVAEVLAKVGCPVPVLSPNTSPSRLGAVRDAANRICGCRSLYHWNPGC